MAWSKCGREKGTDALEYSIFFALLDPAQGPDCHRSWGSSRQMERSNGQTVKLSSPRWDMSTCWFFDWKLISWIEAPNSHRQNVSANLQLLFSDIPWPHVTAQPCSLPAFSVNFLTRLPIKPERLFPFFPQDTRAANDACWNLAKEEFHTITVQITNPVRPPTGQGPCLGCLGGVVGSLIGG